LKIGIWNLFLLESGDLRQGDFRFSIFKRYNVRTFERSNVFPCGSSTPETVETVEKSALMNIFPTDESVGYRDCFGSIP